MVDSHFLTVVDGGYTEWSLWSSCTKTCGGGRQMRTRNCTSPLPIDGGLDCADLGIGGDEESRQCNAAVCPGQIGMYGNNSICTILSTSFHSIHVATHFSREHHLCSFCPFF